MPGGGLEGFEMSKGKMNSSAASRIQSHADKSGSNQGFKGRAQAAAAKNGTTNSGSASTNQSSGWGSGRCARAPPRIRMSDDIKTYHTAESTDGINLPHSGIVLRNLAEALRLKGDLKRVENASEKTVQRYLSGQRVEPATVSAVLARFAELLFDDLTFSIPQVPKPERAAVHSRCSPADSRLLRRGLGPLCEQDQRLRLSDPQRGGPAAPGTSPGNARHRDPVRGLCVPGAFAGAPG